MGWTLPQDWASGMVLAASGTSGLNVQLRDNLLDARRMWESAGAIHLSLSTNQSVSNAIYQPISWDVVDWQVGNTTLWASASGSKLTVPVAGRWELTGVQEWDDNSSGYRGTAWRQNGLNMVHMSAMTPTLSERAPTLPFGDILNLTTADYIEIMAWQSIGAAWNLHGGAKDRTRVTWRFRGAAS